MSKRIQIPMIAAVVLLFVLSAPSANAGPHFRVYVGPPVYSYPHPYYPGPYSMYGHPYYYPYSSPYYFSWGAHGHYYRPDYFGHRGYGHGLGFGHSGGFGHSLTFGQHGGGHGYVGGHGH